MSFTPNVINDSFPWGATSKIIFCQGTLSHFVDLISILICILKNIDIKWRSSGIIDDAPLRFRGEVYHGYHFNCTSCNVELDSTAREVKSRPGFAANDMNELYCLRCHDKMGIPICGACRRPIEERVVTALGKHWHVEVSLFLILL